MNRTETRQRLIDIGIAAERLPIDGQFDLSGANLRGAHLRGAHLSGANLRGATMTGANLRGANLSWANLSGATMTGANLSGAYLGRANLSGATMTGANLSGAYLGEANLNGVCVNWQSHDLIAEILRRAAEDDVSRRIMVGLILISHDWCWDMFLALDIAPAVRDWALDELRKWVKEGDNAPTVLTTTNMSPDDLRDEADRQS